MVENRKSRASDEISEMNACGGEDIEGEEAVVPLLPEESLPPEEPLVPKESSLPEPLGQDNVNMNNANTSSVDDSGVVDDPVEVDDSGEGGSAAPQERDAAAAQERDVAAARDEGNLNARNDQKGAARNDDSDSDDANNNAGESKLARSPDPTDERIQALNDKTKLLTGKMKNNLDEMMQRDVQLNDLEETAEGLAAGARQFQSISKKVNRKMWCSNHKWSFIIACAVIVVAIGLALAIAGSLHAF